ncbi:Panacea domain-containing protein [uncultured Jatrophihabitans sp.]|uniref:Panacea domain-containing protein n=1 Tax=uncultured Jatrophihabitans sp. TaxID=1610747 RepID=UPI0035CC4141
MAFDQPLFSETISAWDMGPVVGQLWNAERVGPAQAAPPSSPDEAALNTIGYVIGRYGGLSGVDLERLTHNERPWLDADARRRELSRRSYKIDLGALRDYFLDEARSEEKASDTPDERDVRAWLAGVASRARAHPSPDSAESLGARRRR